MSQNSSFRWFAPISTRWLAGAAVLLAVAGQAANVSFDFNTDPSASGALTLYGNANWHSTGGAGAATNPNDGYVEVTPSAGNQRGAVVFADFDNGQIIKAFTFEADVRIGNGTTPPADGFSISYVRANDPVLTDVAGGGNPATDDGIWAIGPNCEANLPEEGTQTGISVGFDAWNSGGNAPYCNEADQSIGPDIVGVSVRVDGNLVLQFPTPTLNGDCSDPNSIQTGPTDNTGTPDGLCWAHVKVVLDTNALLNVYWKNTLILSNYQTSYQPSPGRLVFAGRTGNSSEYHHVDNIAVSTIAVPVSPVGITNVAATAIGTSLATLNGQVLTTSGNPGGVTLFYGTSDGGTNAAAWTQKIYLGLQSGTFSNTVTGLAFNTHYYFTTQATNGVGTTWAAPSLSFQTLTPTPASVINLPASGVIATGATLAEQVTSTGGDTPNVTLYYGPADGQTTPSAWSNAVALGLQAGVFSQPISGLVSNKTYYFTANAANAAGTTWAQPSFSFTTLSSNPPPPVAFAVLTYHNDNTRWGVNANETKLTLANVNSNSFGKVFSYDVDGYVYAQPLVMTNVNVPGRGIHNVVYVATEHNSLYAFDADDNFGANAAPLWQTSFINPGAGITTIPNGDVGTTDITPEVGITSTPVIDPVTGTIYVEVKTKEPGPVYVHRLHALDLATGLERASFNSPSVISVTNYPGTGNGDNDGKNPPHVLWNPLRSHCRPALTLLNGAVYMSFASHGDNGPYHGWLFGYNATNVSQQVGVYNATPNGGLGGFWDGGGGPSVDAQGNLYFQTGNGTFDGGNYVSATNNYAMSVLKLATTNGLTLVDYFAPANAVALSSADQDLGSSAPIILPDSAGSVAHPHLVVGGGKTSPIYVMDRDNMGRFNGVAGPNNIVQLFNGSYGGDRNTTPAFFNNALYLFDSNAKIGAYTIANGLFNTTPVETPDTYDNKGGATVCISANGTSNAIAWALYNSGGQSPATPAILRAYNATNLTQKLYSSDQNPVRDSADNAVKFTIPTIVNGKVYVGGQYSLSVYGNATFLETPLIAPNGGTFTNSVVVKLSDATPGTTLYYTLDTSVPGTNSLLYTAPFVLNDSTVVKVRAFKPGSVPSAVVSATFLNSSAIGNGTGLKGEYYSNQLMTFIDPPNLVRTDATVDFEWGNGPPDGSISADDFTVRWTGAVQPQFDETYTFFTTTDDGVRLWVNDQLIIDEWVDQGRMEWSGTIALAAQQRYNIRMEYYENGGGALAHLAWSSPSTTKTIIPQTQLYPVSNPPPVVILTAPVNGATFTASASVSLSADADAQFNSLTKVDFYVGNTLVGSATDLPYSVTATGLTAGSYALKAVATDGSGLSSTSAPVNITVTAGSGQPYGLAARQSAAPFLNMPGAFTGTLPTRLSLTGVFNDTPNLTPVGSLIPYDVNTPLWSDAAVKSRWFVVPNNGAPYTTDEQIAFASTGEWSFPAGTIFVKHFELVTNEITGAKRRLETRLLVRDIYGAVYGVTYKWRVDNSDADLLGGSLNENIAITSASGVRTQTWYYPSPADCLTCHTPQANYVLGVKTRQLNGNLTYPATGNTDNQLRALNQVGLFTPAFNESSISGFARLSSLTNLAASLEERSRSYLDANCSQCHRPLGSGPTVDARYDTPLANQHIINEPAQKGDLGFDGAQIVTPKDVWRSVLYQRMNTFDSTTKMPTLARSLIDSNAVAVIGDWINSLAGTPALAPPTIIPAGAVFTNSIQVTLQHPDSGAQLRYTLDNSLPTINSLPYAGPFTLTSSAVVRANAFETGFNPSVAVSANFTLGMSFQLLSSQYTTNTFLTQVAGTAGKSYVFQATTNFSNWISLSTNTAPMNLFELMDTNASKFPRRFYRALELP